MSFDTVSNSEICKYQINFSTMRPNVEGEFGNWCYLMSFNDLEECKTTYNQKLVKKS